MEAVIPSAEQNAIAAETADARAIRHQLMLQKLAEIGMDIAESLRAQARAALEPDAGAADPHRDLGLSFSRVSRAVRLTLALEARLGGARQAAEADRQDRAFDVPQPLFQRFDHVVRKALVQETVQEVIKREGDGLRREVLRERLEERLFDFDEDFDLTDRPAGQVIAQICLELGLIADWSQFQDEDWALEEARTRPPGSPYASHIRTEPPDITLDAYFEHDPGLKPRPRKPPH